MAFGDRDIATEDSVILQEPEFYPTAGYWAPEGCRWSRALLQKLVKSGPCPQGATLEETESWLLLVIPGRMKAGAKGTFRELQESTGKRN